MSTTVTTISVRATAYDSKSVRISDVINEVQAMGEMSGERFAQLMCNEIPGATVQGNEIRLYNEDEGITRYYQYAVTNVEEF